MQRIHKSFLFKVFKKALQYICHTKTIEIWKNAFRYLIC